MTSTTHTGRPDCLSLACTNRSPLEASKSRIGSNSPAAYAPCGNTCAYSTGIGPCSATLLPSATLHHLKEQDYIQIRDSYLTCQLANCERLAAGWRWQAR